MSSAHIYIIYYSWANTADNHAGMAYLVKKIQENSPDRIKKIEIPHSINKWHVKLQRLHFYALVLWLKLRLKTNDTVLFMEYLGNSSGNQTGMAIKLRDLGVKSRVAGLVHLSGNNLLELYGSEEYIKEGANAVDNILVFGSSLADFFNKLGYGQKVIKTFHYVDTDFYKPSTDPKPEKLQVIHIGSLKRNFEQLKEIVRACPEVDFHICQGHLNLTEYFQGQKNVKLYGYLPETELLKLMQTCHISLSILDDTVGSNVITTSMACGLVNVVSDVGSIRDYCNNSESVLCKKKKDFIDTLNIFNKNRKLLSHLSSNSVTKSNYFKLDFFYTELNAII
jgi:glycosyltransferase involved in cell wall biosynthesis